MQTFYIGSVGTSSIMNIIQEAISLTDGLETKCIYSRNLERAKEYADSRGIAEHCSNYTDLLNRDDIDIIYIASPNKLHFEQALKALEAKKHVIIEKPVAVTRQEVQTLYEKAKENNVFFFEAITTLYMPNYLAFKKLLPSIGKLTKATINFGQYSSKYDAYLRGENPNIFNPELQGGALNDMGIYCIHVAINLFGYPNTVHYDAEKGANGIDLAGKLTLNYSDFVCEISTSKKDAIKSGCFIFGEHGSLTEDGPLIDFANCSALINSQNISINEQPVGNRMIYELQNFRNAILNHDEAFFEASSAQSIAAASILEAARL